MSFVIQHACLACFRSQYVSLLHSALILMHLFVFEKSLSVLCAIVSSKRRSCVADTWKLFDRCNCFVRFFSICFAVLTSSFFSSQAAMLKRTKKKSKWRWWLITNCCEDPPLQLCPKVLCVLNMAKVIRDNFSSACASSYCSSASTAALSLNFPAYLPVPDTRTVPSLMTQLPSERNRSWS